jgi:hypothetical protein
MAEEEKELSPQEKAQFWKNHIKACKDSGLSQTEYCHQNNLKPHRFWYWRKRFKKIAKKEVRFVPLNIPMTDSTQSKTSIITPNGYRIELAAGFDPVAVGQLIHNIRDL